MTVGIIHSIQAERLNEGGMHRKVLTYLEESRRLPFLQPQPCPTHHSCSKFLATTVKRQS